MRNHRRLAEQAIRTPLAIHRSNSDPDCRTYYGVGPRPGIMVAVVADVVNGFVKTGYLTHRTAGAPE
jgi:hypothetical protein